MEFPSKNLNFFYNFKLGKFSDKLIFRNRLALEAIIWFVAFAVLVFPCFKIIIPDVNCLFELALIQFRTLGISTLDISVAVFLNLSWHCNKSIINIFEFNLLN